MPRRSWRASSAAGLRLEVLEPAGADGFLHRFIAQRGPGIHSDPEWKEAFLHPRQAQGIVVQFAEPSADSLDPPPSGDSGRHPSRQREPALPITVLGLRLSARSRERADTQWGAVVQGARADGGDGAFVYRWPGSFMDIAVEIDPVRDEGPLRRSASGAWRRVQALAGRLGAARPHRPCDSRAGGGHVQSKRDVELRMRRALPDDSERLSEIARAAKAHWGYPEAWLVAWMPLLSITPEYVEHQLVYVGARDHAMVGFYALEPRGARWSLEHFWVDPRWHGRGVGRRMFAHALEQVRAVRPGIMVIEADPYAAGFYARMGAQRKGTVPAPVEGDPDRTLPVFEVAVEAV